MPFEPNLNTNTVNDRPDITVYRRNGENLVPLGSLKVGDYFIVKNGHRVQMVIEDNQSKTTKTIYLHAEYQDPTQVLQKSREVYRVYMQGSVAFCTASPYTLVNYGRGGTRTCAGVTGAEPGRCSRNYTEPKATHVVDRIPCDKPASSLCEWKFYPKKQDLARGGPTNIDRLLSDQNGNLVYHNVETGRYTKYRDDEAYVPLPALLPVETEIEDEFWDLLSGDLTQTMINLRHAEGVGRVTISRPRDIAVLDRFGLVCDPVRDLHFQLTDKGKSALSQIQFRCGSYQRYVERQEVVE